MLVLLVVTQIVTLIAVVLLYLRGPRTGEAAVPPGHLAETLVRHDVRLETLDTNLKAGLDSVAAALRADLAHQRHDSSAYADALREAQNQGARQLREEVAASIVRLSTSLAGSLESFRNENRAATEAMRAGMTNDLAAIGQRLAAFISEANRVQIEAREALHTRLTDLSTANSQHQERLRTTVGDSLAKINVDNTAKLEEMRATVDEKLHATLHSRLTESFGQVTDQLNKVHSGLGEMSKLSEGVEDLSRIFTKVKSRGGFAEVQLGMLLEQMLAPSQFARNVRVKLNTMEVVEYAVRFPGPAGETLLPIDAKFPREDWERLEAAYASNQAERITAAGRAFEAAIRTEGERICKKYINPPLTTPHAIMFLPTEGLYAEVMRRDALQAEIQSKCQVTIAGPSTLSAILTSFQMGFHMLALQEKGDEVWKVLEATKTEFRTFEGLMANMEKQVGTVQNTIQKLGVRTRAINRNLREVSDVGDAVSEPLKFEDFTGTVPRLAAAEGD